MAKEQTGALITYAAAGAGTTTSDQHAQAKGLLLYIDITAVGGTPTLTVTLQGRSPTGVYHTILASAALSATGLTVLKVYPGLTAAANSVANDIIPEVYRVSAVIAGGTPSVTATIHAVEVD